VEFEVDVDEDDLDDICAEAENMIRDFDPQAVNVMADVVRDEEIG
jgi:hypothetical protein